MSGIVQRRKLAVPIHRFWLASIFAASLLASFPAACGRAQEEENAPQGAFITVRSPITSAVIYDVKRQCEDALQDGARLVIFDIESGSSEFGLCLTLAEYVQRDLTGTKTVAFVAQPLRGHAVMVALAADELVVGPEATIGDIAHTAQDADEQAGPVELAQYRELARRRYPEFEAVVLGMLDPELQVWEVETARGRRYVDKQGLDELERKKEAISSQILIESGQLGNFSGENLRSMGFAKLVASTRIDVATAYHLSPKTALAEARTGVRWRAVRIRAEGTVTPLMTEFVRRHINEELSRGKDLIFLEIDSPGGLVDSGLDLARYLVDLPGVKTVAYVAGEAISAAAFIALGCDDIVMHPNAKFGDCGVWLMKDGEPTYLPEKQLSLIRTELEILARENGYPEALVRGLIDKDLVVKEARDAGGRIVYRAEADLAGAEAGDLEVLRTVKEAGTFLTKDGRQAQSLGIASETVDSFEGLRAIYGLENDEVPLVSANWVDTLIWLFSRPIVGALLIVAGALAMYVELKVPGIGVAGIVSALCFLLFFWSRVLGGTAVALEVLLFVMGVALVVTEIFVIPGLGVFGFAGAGLMIASLILAGITFTFPQSPEQIGQMTVQVGSTLLALGAAVGGAIMISQNLQHIPLLNRIVQETDTEMDGESTVGDPVSADEVLGLEGVAVTPLRPAGRIQVGEQLIDVVTQGSFIEPGESVRVVSAKGNRIVVEQA